MGRGLAGYPSSLLLQQPGGRIGPCGKIQPGDPHNALLRCLFFIEVHYQCQLSALYITTQDNAIADHLSRNKLTVFFSKLP